MAESKGSKDLMSHAFSVLLRPPSHLLYDVFHSSSVLCGFLWTEIGELEEKQSDYKAAINAFNEAANCYEVSRAHNQMIDQRLYSLHTTSLQTMFCNLDVINLST